MDRRWFLRTSFVFGLSAPLLLTAHAASTTPRVGVMCERSEGDPFVAAFREGLRERGYTENQNIIVDYRYANAELARVAPLTTDLVRLKIDVLVVGGTESAQLARRVTSTVPIVFATAGDPVAAGLASSLAHPGSNTTGISNVSAELSAKQLEILKMALPRLTRVAVFYNPANPARDTILGHIRDAGRAQAIEVRLVQVRQRTDIARAFSTAMNERPGGLLVVSDPILGSELEQIAGLARSHRLPAVYMRREFASVGGLVSYGPDFGESYRRAAAYVDKILKGSKPADLPVEQPTKFEMVINLKTAKALGLTIPPSLLARADQVIE